MNRAYLPSKKIFVLIAVILITGIGIFFYTNQDNKSGASQIVSSEERSKLEQTDTDEDGLSDWEESLWGTDINNPDTDGDGTEDGAEVAANRDPTDGSSDDGLESSSPSATSSSNRNMTAEVGSEVLPRAVILAAAQQNGEEITEDDISRVASSLNPEDMIDFESYTQSDLTTVRDASAEDIRTYLQETVNILSLQSTGQRNPLSVVASELQDDDSRQIDLTPYITQIEKVSRKLREISVPTQYAANHLAIVNSTSRMVGALRTMQRAEVDPMSGVVGAQIYKEAMRSGEDAAERLSQQINEDLQ